MNGVDLVASTGDPAFAIDRDGRIRAWNAACEEVFGLTASEVRGRPCWEVLAGRDDYGNDYCSEKCPLRQMALKGRAVRRCRLEFRDSVGASRPFTVITLLLQGAEPIDPAVVHLIRETYSMKHEEPRRKAAFGPNRSRGEITDREKEVVELLARGASTREIAETLRVSRHTARNHIQHVLHKLHVHSRLEAVVAARRTGLL